MNKPAGEMGDAERIMGGMDKALAEYRAEINQLGTERDTLRAALAAAEGARDAAIKAFSIYGQHTYRCPTHYEGRCFCGFDATNRALRPAAIAGEHR